MIFVSSFWISDFFNDLVLLDIPLSWIDDWVLETVLGDLLLSSLLFFSDSEFLSPHTGEGSKNGPGFRPDRVTRDLSSPYGVPGLFRHRNSGSKT